MMNITSGLPEKQGCYIIFDKTSGLDIPLSPENRKKTDRWFSYIFIFILAILVCLLIYTLRYADINRFKGIDKCGNICGQKNIRYDQWNCTGQDLTLSPIYYDGECMSLEAFNSSKRSGEPAWLAEKWADFYIEIAVRYSLIIFMPVGFSLILALFLRYVTSLTVWTVLLACWIFFPSSVLYLCLSPSVHTDLATIYTFILLLWLLISIPKLNQINLAIKLLRVSSRAVFSSKKVIFNALMAAVVSLAILVTYFTLGTVASSSGHLVQISIDRLSYEPDSYFMVTNYLNTAMAFWMIQFAIGVASLTSSAVIANRYFSRNKSSLTTCTTLLYHSGTVALVSLLSAIMLVPRLVLIALAQISPLRVLTDYCLRYLNGFFSKNVHIMTAMHGTPFCQSGKKAVEISKSNIGDSESLHYLGYALVVLAQILTVIGSTFFTSYLYNGLLYSLYDFYFIFPISYFSSEFIWEHFKVSLSTIFFCINQDDMLKKEAIESTNTTLEEYLDNSIELFSGKIEGKRFPNNLANMQYN